jgi:hypothetical protein
MCDITEAHALPPRAPGRPAGIATGCQKLYLAKELATHGGQRMCAWTPPCDAWLAVAHCVLAQGGRRCVQRSVRRQATRGKKRPASMALVVCTHKAGAAALACRPIRGWGQGK